MTLKHSLSNFARLTKREITESQIFLVAGSLAYTTILAMIPTLAVSFAVFKAFGGLEQLYEMVEPIIVNNLAETASEEAIRIIRSSIENIHAGAVGVGGLVGMMITSMSLLSSGESAINRIWKVTTKRRIFEQITLYWFVITLGPLAFAVALGAATSLQVLPTIFPSGTGLFAITAGGFFGLYRWVPNRPVSWRPALISALFTATIWNLARVAYAHYTVQAVAYDRIYGSLSAIPILLLWIYLIWVIILLGAVFCAALQNRMDQKEEKRDHEMPKPKSIRSFRHH